MQRGCFFSSFFEKAQPTIFFLSLGDANAQNKFSNERRTTLVQLEQQQTTTTRKTRDGGFYAISKSSSFFPFSGGYSSTFSRWSVVAL
jgi:hypothetical protein